MAIATKNTKDKKVIFSIKTSKKYYTQLIDPYEYHRAIWLLWYINRLVTSLTAYLTLFANQ